MNEVFVSPGITGESTKRYTDSTQASISISGGGNTQGNNDYYVDGIPNITSNGTVAFVPPVDAVEEVKVQTTMFDASYGHSNGGGISVSTRSGTNTPHGAVYWYKRLPQLNANSWTANRGSQPRPAIRYHQEGASIGGPVYIPKIYDGRNRTFFWTSYERDRENEVYSATNRVPTPLEEQGNFSQTLSQSGTPLVIYDPGTTVVSGSKATRTPFSGAIIPSNRISPIGAAIITAWPAPNQPGLAKINGINWVWIGFNVILQDQFGNRLDHYISDKQRLFTRYGHTYRDVLSYCGIFPGSGCQFQGNTGNDVSNEFYNFGLDDTYTFSPSMVGTFRVGFVRVSGLSLQGAINQDAASQIHMPQSFVDQQIIKGWPVISLGENIRGVQDSYARTADNLTTVTAMINKLWGRHSLKMGVDYRLARRNSNSPGSNAPGSFTFNSTFTQADPYTASTSNTSGTSMASLLLGLPASGALGYTSPLSLQSHYVAGYFQEDFRVSDKLTLNFGLRYELETPFTERYNRISAGFDPNATLPVSVPGLPALKGGVLFAGVNGNPRTFTQTDWNNFGPRFGFAWSLARKTVVRGGYGLFYSPEAGNTSFTGAVGTFNATTQFIGTVDSGATPYNTIANPFPSGLVTATGSSLGFGAQLGDTLTFENPNRVSPYNQQWQVSLQRQLPSEMLVEAAYVGMLSLKELESFNLNELPDAYLTYGAAQNTSVSNPFYGVFAATTPLGTGANTSQKNLWVRYPQFSSLTEDGNNTGVTTYNALQVKADKRLTRGFNTVVAYTNAHMMRNYMTSIVNTRHYRSVGSFDQRHVLHISGSYHMPFQFAGAGWNRLLRGAFGGWMIGAFFNYNTGTPLSISQANGRPIRIANPKLSGSVENRLGDKTDAGGNVLNPYFNIAAFQALPTQYMVSPEIPYLDELRAPSVKAMNANVSKAFPIHERLRLEFKAEAFNATNHTNFSAPGTNMSTKSTFGVITASSPVNEPGQCRTLQFGFRLAF